MEASLAVMSTCLDKSAMECMELHRLLAEVQGQRKRDLARAQVALGEAEERATKAKKALGKIEAKGIGAVVRIASTEVKAMEVEVRAQAMEEGLHKAKDQALPIKEEVLVVKVLAPKVAVEAVKAWTGEEYHLEILGASRDALW